VAAPPPPRAVALAKDVGVAAVCVAGDARVENRLCYN
jgi:hypothetical protein